jgi:hypothetical protein
VSAKPQPTTWATALDIPDNVRPLRPARSGVETSSLSLETTESSLETTTPRAAAPPRKTALGGDSLAEPDDSLVDPDREGLDLTRGRAAALGIDARLGEHFLCVLPDCDRFARLHTVDPRPPQHRPWWAYSCLCWGTRGLGDVRGALAYSKVPATKVDPRKRMSPTEAMRWMERLDYDAGHVWRLRDVDLHPPEDAPGSAALVAQHLRLFLGLGDERTLAFRRAHGFTFARPFGAAYAGVQPGVIREGVDWLRRHGLLVEAGRTGGGRPMIVWRTPEVMA